MRLKLDENVHGDVAGTLRARNHDVTTAQDEGLAGRSDADIAAAVLEEKRALVTFDLDFADPRRYPPQNFPGLVVLRLRAPTAVQQVTCLTRFFAANPEVAGKLWIVEESRTRDWTP